MSLKVNIKLLSNLAKIPSYSLPTDIGLDLTAISKHYDEYDNVVYDTGVAIEVPDGYGGFIFPRGSISKLPLNLANSVGVIDPGYTGSIICKMKIKDKNINNDYDIGDRVAQLIFLPVPKIEFKLITELTTSLRGSGGFGSTGK
jgi:dUTP pyrophosphatase